MSSLEVATPLVNPLCTLIGLCLALGYLKLARPAMLPRWARGVRRGRFLAGLGACAFAAWYGCRFVSRYIPSDRLVWDQRTCVRLEQLSEKDMHLRLASMLHASRHDWFLTQIKALSTQPTPEEARRLAGSMLRNGEALDYWSALPPEGLPLYVRTP
jgi:hypothetical protein